MTGIVSKIVIYTLIVGFLSYFINDYINLKSAYRVSQKTVEVLQNRRKVVDIEMLSVEKRQNDNFVTQNKYLLEMDKKGYISTRDGRTPSWMLYSSENDS